jgi:hypothetical protein
MIIVSKLLTAILLGGEKEKSHKSPEQTHGSKYISNNNWIGF